MLGVGPIREDELWGMGGGDREGVKGGCRTERTCELSERSIYLCPCEASSSFLSFPHRLEFLPLAKAPNALKTWPPQSFSHSRVPSALA